jgi:hypothetical protein
VSVKIKPVELVLYFLIAVTGVISLVFLYWHLQIGLVRYFDVDEYAHLHWASHLFVGKLPFVDYLSFFAPAFHWFLAPIFLFGWGTTAPFIDARVVSWIVFVSICITGALLYHEIRKNWLFATLTVLLLAWLPMPFDKYIEVRPDSLATLLTLLGIFFQVVWMRQINSKLSFEKFGFLSGIFYSLSLLVLAKMAPNIAIGVGIALLWGFSNRPPAGFLPKKLKMTALLGRYFKFVWPKLKWFVIGLAVPLVLFGLWLLTLGNLPLVLYSLIKLPIEANKISKYFIMMPMLFFYPNGIFYGADGWNKILVTNHIVWIIGLFFGTYRLFTPFNYGGRKTWLIELLVASQFIIQVLFYVGYVPLKHAQYLIPIGIFVAFYGADAVQSIWDKVKHNLWLMPIFGGVMIIFLIYIYQIFMQSNMIKLTWTNQKAFDNMTSLYKKIPQTEYVLDLDGRMLYNPDPYYVCCIPFGQFAEFLSQPLPNLPQALEKTNTKYINQGELERVKTLPWDDQQYIFSHYHSDHGDNSFLIRNDINN